jgi:hypothetical protein
MMRPPRLAQNSQRTSNRAGINTRGNFAPSIGHEDGRPARLLWADAVEKGKNEQIEIFAFAPVETGFS